MLRYMVQLVTFCLATIGMLVWTLVFRRRLWLAAPAVLWLLHVAIYYACVLWFIRPTLGSDFFTTWSSVIRLHAVITLVFAPYTLSTRKHEY